MLLSWMIMRRALRTPSLACCELQAGVRVVDRVVHGRQGVGLAIMVAALGGRVLLPLHPCWGPLRTRTYECGAGDA